MADEATAAQLALIGEISRVFAAEGVPLWAFGGWAVDLLAGRVTRAHADVDLVIRLEDAERARALLGTRGYGLIEHRVEDLIFTKNGQKVELYFITTDEAGRTITPGRWADWPWSANAFEGPLGRIGDVACRVVHPAAQLEIKEGYLAQTGARLRPKDRADLEVLRAAVGRVHGIAPS